MNSDSPLPIGWAEATLPEMVGPNGLVTDGDWVESKDQDGAGDVKLIQLADIGDGYFERRSIRRMLSSRAREMGCTFLREGDLLIARMPDPLGRSCVFPPDAALCVTVVDVCIVRFAHQELSPRWLMHFLNAPQCRAAIEAQQSGTTRRRISKGNLTIIPLPVPPRAEQERILGSLDLALSGLDQATAELQAAKRKLALYRQSLLKSAVEGALTAEWREQNPPKEIGADLLTRILSERRARWEARQLQKFKAQGRDPPKHWQNDYRHPVAPDLNGLPTLPRGWAWASAGQLLDSLTSGSRDWAPYYGRGDCTFVMAQNIRPWRPDFSFRQAVDPPEFDRDRARSEIRIDDLLVTIVGANTGQACRVAKSLPLHFVCQSVALLRPVFTEISEFMNAVLNSPAHGQRYFEAMNYGAGRPHLSFEQLELLPVPLPPLSEQAAIAEALILRLEALDDQETAIEHGLRLTSAQRQNILRAAFSGQLVPQDPNDEPASVLLDRIRAQRNAAADKPAARRPRKAKIAA